MIYQINNYDTREFSWAGTEIPFGIGTGICVKIYRLGTGMGMRIASSEWHGMEIPLPQTLRLISASKLHKLTSTIFFRTEIALSNINV